MSDPEMRSGDKSSPRSVPPPTKRPRWRLPMIIAAIVIASGIVFGGVVWRQTSQVADAANQFLETAATSSPAAAWSTAAPSFQQVGPESQWETFARQIGVTDYKSATWTNRQLRDNLARLQGTITTRSGRSIPMTIDLVKIDGKWLVQMVRTDPTGF